MCDHYHNAVGFTQHSPDIPLVSVDKGVVDCHLTPHSVQAVQQHHRRTLAGIIAVLQITVAQHGNFGPGDVASNFSERLSDQGSHVLRHCLVHHTRCWDQVRLHRAVDVGGQEPGVFRYTVTANPGTWKQHVTSWRFVEEGTHCP